MAIKLLVSAPDIQIRLQTYAATRNRTQSSRVQDECSTAQWELAYDGKCKREVTKKMWLLKQKNTQQKQLPRKLPCCIATIIMALEFFFKSEVGSSFFYIYFTFFVITIVHNKTECQQQKVQLIKLILFPNNKKQIEKRRTYYEPISARKLLLLMFLKRLRAPAANTLIKSELVLNVVITKLKYPTPIILQKRVKLGITLKKSNFSLQKRKQDRVLL